MTTENYKLPTGILILVLIGMTACVSIIPQNFYEKKNTSEFNIPEELEQIFSENADFEKAFKNLTTGRQRGYLLHFDKPKQSKTKISRIEENMTRIMDGYGLNDCVCGLSKRKPNCDGSHKQLEKSE